MSENTAVVKEVFEAFAARDADRLLSLLDPEFEFYGVTAERAGRQEPYRGIAGLRAYFRDVARVWDESCACAPTSTATSATPCS